MFTFTQNFYILFLFIAWGKATIDADVQWLTNNSATVTWHGQYGDSFYLSLRRIKYENNGSIIVFKWFRAMSAGTYRMNIEDKITTEEVFKLGTQANFSGQISLPQGENYEIYISSTGIGNASVSIFLDRSHIRVFGERHNLYRFSVY